MLALSQYLQANCKRLVHDHCSFLKISKFYLSKTSQTVGGVDVKDHVNLYNADELEGQFRIQRSKIFIHDIKSKYIENKRKHIARNSYLEIGPAQGYITTELAQLFENITIIEPNSIFQEIIKNKFIKMDIPNINYLNISIEDFDINKHLSSTDIKTFDLITLQHVLWTVHTNEWRNIIEKLYDILNENGIMVITQTPPYDPSTDLFRTYISYSIKCTDYILELCKNYKTDYWENQIVFTLPESTAINIIMTMYKVVNAFYDKSLLEKFDENKNEYIENIKEYLRKNDYYFSDKIDGQNMIQYKWINSHVVINK